MAFEPNFVPGFANRLVAPYVKAAAVHFPETGKFFRHCEVTGVPVRAAFFAVCGPPPDSRPNLLIFGGSQGAHAINQVVMDSAAELLARVPELHIVHQTGERDYNDAQVAYAKMGKLVEAHRFLDDMPARFAQASLLICRSGASTVAEVAAAGRPAIFVPLPTAADDHQRRNAEALARAGGAVMLEQKSLTRESLVETVSSLLNDPNRLRHMSETARSMSHPDAAAKIAAMAARVAGRPRPS
jgi:UDP-N-acetylglucosamine--N-acetylmuramyl-(pentapeptide) pyrophosphoryl-undecaprenol N-acetylglucosamine transferase